MTAVGFCLFSGGLAILFIFQDMRMNFLLWVALAGGLLGIALMFSGLVTAIWRYLP